MVHSVFWPDRIAIMSKFILRKPGTMHHATDVRILRNLPNQSVPLYSRFPGVYIHRLITACWPFRISPGLRLGIPPCDGTHTKSLTRSVLLLRIRSFCVYLHYLQHLYREGSGFGDYCVNCWYIQQTHSALRSVKTHQLSFSSCIFWQRWKCQRESRLLQCQTLCLITSCGADLLSSVEVSSAEKFWSA